MLRPTLALASGCCFAALVACSVPSMPEPDEGALFFAQNCQSCHGAGGQGDGPLAESLAEKPRDLTTLARENGGVFPTATALSYIYGDPEGGHLARVMPQFGAQLADDLVPLDVDGVETPTPRALVALLAFMETLQR